MRRPPRLHRPCRALLLGLLAVPLLLVSACTSQRPHEVLTDALAIAAPPKGEPVPPSESWIPVGHETRIAVPPVRLERVSAAVPWPRGLVFLGDELIVLARGRHRNAGGVDPDIEDSHGALFRVDPDVAEPVVPGRLASGPVATNAELFAEPDGDFDLYRGDGPPSEDRLMERPFCTLVYDPESRNLFVLGFSGVDLPQRRFLKNATDSVHRYDLRTGEWHLVERHDPNVVPATERGYVVPNQYYPHHDPHTNPPPHGWVNGPDAACVAGRFLYVAGKDNHLVAAYDLSPVRRDPSAGPPPSRAVLGPRVRLRTPAGERPAELLGPSALAARDGWLYVGYRTTSVVVRFRLDDEGEIVDPHHAELIAVFEPWDPEAQRSANLIDIAFDPEGSLFVSCAKTGGIWKVGVPDPEHPFYGNDRGDRPTSAPLYADLARFTGKRTGCGNIVFDDQGRLYLCSGNYDTDSQKLAGVIYRVTPLE